MKYLRFLVTKNNIFSFLLFKNFFFIINHNLYNYNIYIMTLKPDIIILI